VAVQDQDLHKVVLSYHHAPFYRLGQWTPAFAVLPTGIHRVEITGVRGNESSGLALDDVEIHLCSHFEGEFCNQFSLRRCHCSRARMPRVQLGLRVHGIRQQVRHRDFLYAVG
jgi:hypothetical protein